MSQVLKIKYTLHAYTKEVTLWLVARIRQVIMRKEKEKMREEKEAY